MLRILPTARIAHNNGISQADMRWIELCDAIVQQAVTDYKYARRDIARFNANPPETQKQFKKLRDAQRTVKDVTVFFHGEWADLLCGNVDPLMIFKKVEAEIDDCTE